MCLNGTHSKVRISKHLSDTFPVRNSLKDDDLSPLLFNFILKHAVKKVQENQVALKLNAMHQLLVYVDHVNVLEDNINTTKKNKTL
jgi:hypothetical protein